MKAVIKHDASKAAGHIVKRGKLKVWTGVVPATPIEEAIEKLRHGRAAKKAPLPDYYARLTKRQPKPLSADATRRFWEER